MKNGRYDKEEKKIRKRNVAAMTVIHISTKRKKTERERGYPVVVLLDPSYVDRLVHKVREIEQSEKACGLVFGISRDRFVSRNLEALERIVTEKILLSRGLAAAEEFVRCAGAP
jgi:hypothetical protein